MGEVLLSILPFEPSPEYISQLEGISPGIKVISVKTPLSAREVPKEISDETWRTVTVLLTLFVFPTKEQAPNLRYVQLISAGCNHVFGNPLFEETEIAFCTANGVHPYDAIHSNLRSTYSSLTEDRPQITEWIFATFLAHQMQRRHSFAVWFGIHCLHLKLASSQVPKPPITAEMGPSPGRGLQRRLGGT